MDNFNFKEVLEDTAKDFGHANIVIAGKTGVGKSTLINAIFEENIAETGIGEPVSQNFKEYKKNDFPISIFDTKGLELAGYRTILDELKEQIELRKSKDVKEHIHVAWYCINEISNRYEDGEVDFINELSKSIPVIVVFTQCYRSKKNELFDKVQVAIPNAKAVVRTLALPDPELNAFEQKGLKELVQMTSEVIPEGIRAAFVAAQKVDLELRRETARKWIAAAATSAGAVGAAPIPFSDAIALAPIQIGMLSKISSTMGLPMNEAFLKTMVSSAIGVVGGILVGRNIVTGILKLIPGAGTVLGGVISSTTAASLTTIMGEAYLSVLFKLISNKGSNLSPEEIASAYREELKHRKSSSSDNE